MIRLLPAATLILATLAAAPACAYDPGYAPGWGHAAPAQAWYRRPAPPPRWGWQPPPPRWAGPPPSHHWGRPPHRDRGWDGPRHTHYEPRRHEDRDERRRDHRRW